MTHSVGPTAGQSATVSPVCIWKSN